MNFYNIMVNFWGLPISSLQWNEDHLSLVLAQRDNVGTVLDGPTPHPPSTLLLFLPLLILLSPPPLSPPPFPHPSHTGNPVQSMDSFGFQTVKCNLPEGIGWCVLYSSNKSPSVSLCESAGRRREETQRVISIHNGSLTPAQFLQLPETGGRCPCIIMCIYISECH